MINDQLDRRQRVRCYRGIGLLVFLLGTWAPRGFTEVTQTPTPTVTSSATVVNVSASEARALLDSGTELLFLDVREPSEFSSGHIEDATNMPWNSGVLIERHTQLPEKPIVVYCGSGFRSGLASQFLVANGHTDIFNMTDGYGVWTQLPTRTPTSTPTTTLTSTPTATPPGTLRADINQDGTVDEKDLFLLQKDWLRQIN